MAQDREPDPTKQTAKCKKLSSILQCEHMKETGGGFEGEQYRCAVCRAAVYLDYDDMR